MARYNDNCSASSQKYVTTPNLGQWYHIVGVGDSTGNTLILYVDGVQRAQNPACSSGPTGTGSLRIGRDPFSGGVGDWDGPIDDVRIYNRALSASEVAALYAGNTAGAARMNASSVTLQNGTTLGPANGLVGHWTFDGADVTNKVYDRAGTNHGYMSSGMPTSTAKTIGKLGQALTFDGTNDNVQITGLMGNTRQYPKCSCLGVVY